MDGSLVVSTRLNAEEKILGKYLETIFLVFFEKNSTTNVVPLVFFCFFVMNSLFAIEFLVFALNFWYQGSTVE